MIAVIITKAEQKHAPCRRTADADVPSRHNVFRSFIVALFPQYQKGGVLAVLMSSRLPLHPALRCCSFCSAALSSK